MQKGKLSYECEVDQTLSATWSQPRRSRYAGSQSSGEPIGPLCDVTLASVGGEAAAARPDQEERRVETDHEDNAQSQSSQTRVQRQQLFTSIGDRPWLNLCGRVQHIKVREELLQYFSDSRITPGHTSSRLTNQMSMLFVRRWRMRASWSRPRNRTRLHSRRIRRRSGLHSCVPP